jgi:hypothetical protein
VEIFTKSNPTAKAAKSKHTMGKKNPAFYTDPKPSKFKLAVEEEPHHKLIKSR